MTGEFDPAKEVGWPQDPPLITTYLPSASVATQKVVVGHETAVNDAVPSITSGVDHVEPLKRLASPLRSTATQKVEVGHETALTPPFALVSAGELLHVRAAFDDAALAADPWKALHRLIRKTPATATRTARINPP
jgi:hypothetical protein